MIRDRPLATLLPWGAAALAGLGALDVAVRQPGWLAALANPLARDVVLRVPTHRRAIALTFDDGPDDIVTPALLDVLRRHGATATFFLMGSKVPGNESLVRRIVAEGHELGNHLMDATPTVRQSIAEFARDLVRCDRLLEQYADVRYVRPASGWIRPRQLAAVRAHGHRCALGSVVLMRDPVEHPARAERLLRLRARPGAVLVLHEGTVERAGIVDCVDRLLDHLTRSGYAVLSLSALVALPHGDADAR